MKPVQIGLLGLGTVGGGVVQVLARNGEEIARRAGRGMRIACASARLMNKPRPFSLDHIPLRNDPFSIVRDPEVDVVVELIGGIEPARKLVMTAIDHRKHVVTANKALIAHHGNEIFAHAQRNGVMVAFEAAVAGGIPIIKAIREGLSGNRIQWLAGIINGTTNYILTEMWERGQDFKDALAAAQKLGYAEADPTFDVEGIDAAHKLTILSAIAFGIPLQFDKVYTEGISKLTRDDLVYASELGYRIKHLGIARRTDKGIELRVHPALVPAKRLLASVNGVRNAVVVEGDAVGPTLYYGAGAGAEPTASAVIADLVDVVRALTSDPENRVPHLAFQPDALRDLPICPMAGVETAYYLRLRAMDKPGVLADVTRILGNHAISIEAILQKAGGADARDVPIVILTHKALEANIDHAMKEIEALNAITDRIMRIRIEELG